MKMFAKCRIFKVIFQQNDQYSMIEKQKESSKDFIYPIPFDEFVEYREKQTANSHNNYNIHEFKKLKQLKKMLQQTESKIQNRIKLFKRVSIDLNKKKNLENKQKIKIKQYSRRNDYKQNDTTFHRQAQQKQKKLTFKEFDTTMAKRSMNSRLSQRTHSEFPLQNHQQNAVLPKKVEQIYQQKMENAKIVKDLKERNKRFLHQRNIKEMRQKVQSANLIRKARAKALESKAQCGQEKFREVLHEKEEKFQNEMSEYQELQRNLQKLQKQEREALIIWKRTMEEA